MQSTALKNSYRQNTGISLYNAPMYKASLTTRNNIHHSYHGLQT